jgi:hypothetical protein
MNLPKTPFRSAGGARVAALATVLALGAVAFVAFVLLGDGETPDSKPGSGSKASSTETLSSDGNQDGERVRVAEGAQPLPDASEKRDESKSTDPAAAGADASDLRPRLHGRVTSKIGEAVGGARVLWLAVEPGVLERYRVDPRMVLLEIEMESWPDGAPRRDKTPHEATETDAEGRYEILLPAGTKSGSVVAYREGFAVAIVALDGKAEKEPGATSDLAPPTAIEAEAPLETPAPAASDADTATNAETPSPAEIAFERDITLVPATRIAGRVLESGTEDPASGMIVRADPIRDGPWFVHAQEDAQKSPRAVVDGDGNYALIGLPPGEYSIAPKSDGGDFVSLARAKARKISVEASTNLDDVDFAVERGGSITVLTVDEDGRPIEGAGVTVMPADPVAVSMSGAEDILSSNFSETRTGRDGSAVLRGARIGVELRIHSQKEGRVSTASDDFTLTVEKPSTSVRVVLERGFTASGIVVTEDGRPVPGSQVYATRDGADQSSNFPFGLGSSFGIAEGDGRFRLTGLARGTHTLRVLPQGSFLPDSAESGLEITIVDSDIEGLRLTARGAAVARSADGAVAGIVVDDLGNAVSGAEVKANPIDPNSATPFTHAPASTTSDAEGRFALDELSGVEVDLTAKRDGYAETEPLRTPIGSKGVVLRLARNAVVRGRVVDRDGALIAGAPILVTDLMKAEAQPGMAEWMAAMQGGSTKPPETDEEGRFEISAPPSRVVLSSRPAGYARAKSKPLRLNPGDTKSGVEIVVSRGATVLGSVTAADQSAVGDARVRIFSVDSDNASPTVAELLPELMASDSSSATSEADGSFEILRLEAGTYRLRAEHESWAPSETVTISLRDDEEQTIAPLVLREGAKVTGRVLDGDEPAQGVMVQLSGSSTTLHQALVGNDGDFELRGLPPGEYSLLAIDTASAAQGQFRTKTRIVTLELGETVEVEIVFGKGFRIHGKVEGLEAGPARMLILVDKDAPATESLRTDDVAASIEFQRHQRGMGMVRADNTFEIADVEPGEYVLLVARQPIASTPTSAQEMTFHRHEVRVIDKDVEADIEIKD